MFSVQKTFTKAQACTSGATTPIIDINDAFTAGIIENILMIPSFTVESRGDLFVVISELDQTLEKFFVASDSTRIRKHLKNGMYPQQQHYICHYNCPLIVFS